ncbi:hypothetical protein NXC14_PB00324 (plasmid) [Rhizobium sp. NXC14]|uniref:hypothetical protein n=1 Tax=Rhizobium sp. NXC14 TaxID=1981173 RepID=UPI000A203507|nr:hypothetical protein [Rhizobium sp. NXC14]ARO33145.1 hypothetical protein NXC14_PB00324 [Rhizobium sp. NXC14]
MTEESPVPAFASNDTCESVDPHRFIFVMMAETDDSGRAGQWSPGAIRFDHASPQATSAAPISVIKMKEILL